MIPDDPGIWMYHCHFDEHMQAGMMALYKANRDSCQVRTAGLRTEITEAV
jgi:hephaestin